MDDNSYKNCDSSQSPFRRRLTKYVKIKSLIKNNDMKEYLNFVDQNQKKWTDRLEFFYGKPKQT